MGEICCFAGHRNPPERVRPLLADAIERHISEYGVTDFLVGNYGGFDRMTRSEVVKSKARHPGVSVYLMLAFLPRPGQCVERNGCDGIIYPEGLERVPPKAAILRLNHLMLEDSLYLIAYVSHISGGAYQTMEDARRRERHGQLHISNLA